MAVRIQVAADAAQVISAFDKINAAIRKTGQEGKAFGDLDFNHPELRDLEADLRRVQQRFADLEKIGQGATPKALRKMQAKSDPLYWRDATDAYYPDDATRANHQAAVGRYIFDGTRFAPQEVPPAPAPSPSPEPAYTPPPKAKRRRALGWDGDDDEDEAGGDEDKEAEGGGREGGFGRRSVRSVAGMAKQTLGGLLAYAGLQGVAGTVSHALTQSSDEAQGADVLWRQMKAGAEDFDHLRQSVRDASEGLGITYVQAERLAGVWSHLTSQQSSAAVLSGVRDVAGAARGYGLDPALFVRAVGAAAAASADRDLRGGKAFDPKEFLTLAASTAMSSGQSAQMDDVLQMLSGVVQNQSRMLIDHDNVGAYAAAYAGLVGANPSLRGTGGMELLNSIDGSIRNGGAMGMASQVFSWRALDAAGISNPWAQQWQNQGGAWEQIRGGHGTTADAQLAEWRREYGSMLSGRGFGHETDGDMRAYLALGNQWGISGRQAEAYALNPHADTNAVGKLFERMGIDPKKMNPTALNDILKVSGLSGGGLADYGNQVLRRTDLRPDERQKIANETDPEKLRAELMEVLAAHGMPETDSTKIVDAATKLENSLTALGTDLLGPMLLLKDAVIGLTDVMGWVVRSSVDAAEAAYGGEGASDARKRLGGDVDGAGKAASKMWNTINGDDGIAKAKAENDDALRDDFYGSLRNTESSGGKNLGSRDAAYGPYQFMPSTWSGELNKAVNAGDPFVIDWMKRAGLNGDTAHDEDVLRNGRLDEALSKHMAQRYEADSIIPALSKAGVPISNLAMYAGWHWGEGGGPKVMLAPDTASMASVVGDKAAAANAAELAKYPTVGAWKAHFAHRFNPNSYDATALPPDLAATAAAGMAGADGRVPLVVQGSFQLDVHDAKSGRKLSTHHLPLTQVGAPRPHNAPVAPTQVAHPPDSSGAYHAMLASLNGGGGMPAAATPGGY